MKKILLLSVLVLFLGLGLIACGNSGCENSGDKYELIGEWTYLRIPWFRFYEDGRAVNLQDGEKFTWNEDGSLDALIYESWSIRDDTLTVTWVTGDSFNYRRAD